MKYLAMASTALFLLAGHGLALAQTDTTGSTTTTQGGNGDATAGGDNQCGDQTASSSYQSFSEKCRLQIDAWALSQKGASAKFDGDVAIGTKVPDSVEVVEVPVYRNYGYAMLNDRRVLVDRTTHEVVRVY